MLKLSIITVNLNNKLGLQKTIESILNQSFTEYEYIVIDGASTDGSIEVIKQYSNRITYWVSETDKGIYNAMNKGIIKAKGEYCYFLNSGDYLINKNVLFEICHFHLNEDIVFGNIQKLINGKPNIDKGPHTSYLTFNNFYVGTINHMAAFQRRALFEKYGLFDENYKIVSDWLFYLKSIGLGEATVKYLDILVANFDLNGISNQNYENCIAERNIALKEYVPSRIINDYKTGYLNIVYHLNKYKLSWFLFRLLNKCVFYYEKLLRQ